MVRVFGISVARSLFHVNGVVKVTVKESGLKVDLITRPPFGAEETSEKPQSFSPSGRRENFVEINAFCLRITHGNKTSLES